MLSQCWLKVEPAPAFSSTGNTVMAAPSPGQHVADESVSPGGLNVYGDYSVKPSANRNKLGNCVEVLGMENEILVSERAPLTMGMIEGQFIDGLVQELAAAGEPKALDNILHSEVSSGDRSRKSHHMLTSYLWMGSSNKR